MCIRDSGESAAGTLRQAINSGDVPPGKIALIRDALAFGPLNCIRDIPARIDWLNNLAIDPREDENWDWIDDQWDLISNWNGETTVFWSRYNSFEHTLYLILAKLIDRVIEFGFIDVSDFKRPGFRYLGTGEFNVPQLAKTLELRRRLTQKEIGSAIERFDFLALEDKPIRYVKDGELLGGEYEVHDPLIIKHVGREWQKAVRIVANVLIDEFDEQRQTGDWYIFNRIKALVANGQFECAGSVKYMRRCEVRLAS